MRWNPYFMNLAMAVLLPCFSVQAETSLSLSSPDETITAILSTSGQGRLTLAITQAGGMVIEPSPLGVTVDNLDLGLDVSLGQPSHREIQETYVWRGVKSQATNHCMAYDVPVTHQECDRGWVLEVRVFDDGVAYRYNVPGEGPQHVSEESTAWCLPQKTKVWIQNDTASYEGNYYAALVEDIVTKTDKGDVLIGCPVTAELATGGYALISEACLYGYSGMTLRPTGTGRLEAVFQDDSKGWDVDGPLVSPWRVTVVARDLNALVNSTLISNLGEAPDADIFPEGVGTSWIKPGKGLITWAVFMNDGAQWHRQKWFVDMCAAMHCEYLLVDGGWRTEKWGFLKDGGDLWARLKELCDYAAERNVDIFVWNAFPEGRIDGPGLTDPQARRAFFRQCKEAGAKGVKIDFFNSESKKTIDAYEAILRETAEQKLMVNFHGANKPTGEVRTWPHEITREGLREQEYLLWDRLPLNHYGALPFSRMVAGHGDFLPGYVRQKYLKNTTAVFQIATSVIFTSPFICWPDHPEAYLESPFLSLIRTMPPVWDETVVLEGSAIGTFVAFARRSGTDWYVALLNCQDKETQCNLKLAFLGQGDYQATLYHDGSDSRFASRIEAGLNVKKGQQLSLTLQPGGGFVGKFNLPTEYTK